MRNKIWEQQVLPQLLIDDCYSNFTISPLPMQYLGSKARISAWIINSITKHFPQSSIFFDLFAGTGVVAWAARGQNFQIYANDIQPYSSMILRSLFTEERKGLAEVSSEISSLNNDQTLLKGERWCGADLLHKEKQFYEKYKTKDFSWKEYSDFCEGTPLITESSDEIRELRKKKSWNLFLKYYANTYFGVRQTLALDTIREYADGLEAGLRNHTIAATVSVMTYAVSSTTHLAQFLKPTSEQRVFNLMKKREFDIINEVSKRIANLCNYPLPEKKAKVYNFDYKEALCAIELDRNWIIYVDPPYFKEHYSRYYHVLDTFCLYDYPFLTINPRTKRITAGRYRQNRHVSEFGLKASVENAFRDLFRTCYEKDANIVLSYADTSLVTKKTICRIAKDIGYSLSYDEKALMHSGQGQPRNKRVTEILFFLSA